MAGPTICRDCGKGAGFSSAWDGRDLCPSWYHKVCVYLQDVQNKDLDKVGWMCRPCRKKKLRVYQEHGKLVDELGKQVERLNRENEMLNQRNKALEGKLGQGCTSSNLDDYVSKIVASTENLNQKLHEVKDEIINTVVNVHASVWGDVSAANDVGATSVPVPGNKRNILTDMKDEIIGTMVNLQANPITGENVNNAKSYAAVTKGKKSFGCKIY